MTLLTTPSRGGAELNPTLQSVKSEEKTAWKEFSSHDNGFVVEFPKLPDHIHQKVKIPKTELELEYDTYVSEPSENVVYVVSVWNYPTQIDMSKPEVNLKDGFSGMIAALPGSEVEHMKMVDVQGFKALEFLVKNDELYFQGKLILVHNTLYQVFAVYKDKEKMAKDYKRFASSFKLLNPEERTIAPKKARNSTNI